METDTNKRCANFSKDEEYLLISLVAKYKDVIESKETNAVTWKEKNEKWLEVEKEFNANSGLNGCRSVKMLKAKYVNLKKKTKKKICRNKLNLNQTGGGPFTQEIITDVDAAITDLLGQRITGLPSVFDSDKDMSHNDGLQNIQPESLVDISGETETIELIIDESHQDTADTQENSENTIRVDGNWTKYCPRDLQQPINSKLVVNNRKAVLKRRNVVTKEYNSLNRELIEKKLDFVMHQRKKFDEENSLKILSLQKDLEIKDQTLEKVNLEIELLKKQMELKQKQLQFLNKDCTCIKHF